MQKKYDTVLVFQKLMDYYAGQTSNQVNISLQDE